MRDFAVPAAVPTRTTVIGPSTFLKLLAALDRSVVEQRLEEQAAAIGIPVDDLLNRLGRSVPSFVAVFRGS